MSEDKQAHIAAEDGKLQEQQFQTILLILVVNIFLVVVNLVLIYLAGVRFVDLREQIASTEKSQSVESHLVQLQSLKKQVSALEQSLSALNNAIVPPEKLEKEFTEKISSSLQLLNNKINQLREEVKNTQAILGAEKK